MKVAINILPLKTAHKGRGIGYYTANLLEALKKDDSVEIQEFINLSELRGADVIHYPWFDLFFHTLPIKRPIPTVLTIHDVIPLVFAEHYQVGIRGKLNFFLQRLALKSCHSFITDSQTAKGDIVKYLKIRASQITVIPLAADAHFKVLSDPQLLHTKRRDKLPDQFLLYVGDANWTKNLPFLIKGFKKIIEDENFKKVKLILVGAVFLKNLDNIDHPELASLKEVNRLIKDYQLIDSIIRVGNLDTEELAAYYNLATVYVQPSLYEGFGLPILQAMSCGTPVVSSNGGSLKEVGDQAAVYFDPHDLPQFVSIVTDILQSKSLQDKLSRLGLDQAAKFSWERVADETKGVYRKLLDQKPS